MNIIEGGNKSEIFFALGNIVSTLTNVRLLGSGSFSVAMTA